jgi:hypothetical protein
MPARKNLIPAKFNGSVNCNPTFIPANAVDHRKHARMAKNVVLNKYFFTLPFLLFKNKRAKLTECGKVKN